MQMLKSKTAWLGAVCIVLAVVGDKIPWVGGVLSMPPDVLLLTGLGLIFGRDAIRKIQGGTGA